MGLQRDSVSIMRPGKNATKVYLPIAFEYSKGKTESNKTTALWVVILGVIGLLVGFGIMFSKDGFILGNIAMGLLVLFGFSLIIRFGVLKEHKVRNRYLEKEAEDYKIDYEDMWGIFSIDNSYPYYARMRNGKTALFVKFEKDVVVGKVDDYRFEHYEAIGDAYNLAASMGVDICHIDYMDVVGTDDRLDDCFKSLSNIPNPDMRGLMTDIYTNLQELLNERVSTFDVYVFTFRSGESSFWFQIQGVINCMLSANYRSFKILNEDDLRGLSKSILNLKDFSVYEAYLDSLKLNNYSGVTPIEVVSSDGVVTKLNMSSVERQDNKGKKNVAGSNISSDDSDEVDIF